MLLCSTSVRAAFCSCAHTGQLGWPLRALASPRPSVCSRAAARLISTASTSAASSAAWPSSSPASAASACAWKPRLAGLGDAHYPLIAGGPRGHQPVPLQVIQCLGSVAQPLDWAEHGDEVALGQLPPTSQLLEQRTLYGRVVHLPGHGAQYTYLTRGCSR